MTEGTTSMESIKAEGYDVTRFNTLRHGVLSLHRAAVGGRGGIPRPSRRAGSRARSPGTIRGKRIGTPDLIAR
jgi:hypothetical protein